MNGSSNKLVGCQIKITLIVGLLVSLAWTLPVDEKKAPPLAKEGAVNTAEPVEVAPLVEKDSAQLRFPPFDNNGAGFFDKFGEKFRNKWTSKTTTTTTTTTTQMPMDGK